MIIEDYAFGRMRIDGRLYTNDLMILPDGAVSADWWRRRGHVVGASDLKLIVDSAPEILIIGTGAYGRMRPDPALESDLGERGIRLLTAPTAEAVTHFNRLPADVSRAAAFHLTC